MTYYDPYYEYFKIYSQAPAKLKHVDTLFRHVKACLGVDILYHTRHIDPTLRKKERKKGYPGYPLVAWISYARGFPGRYDSAENESDHKKFPRMKTLHFHRHFASYVTSGL